jgi:flagellar basal body-associated protein FliL
MARRAPAPHSVLSAEDDGDRLLSAYVLAFVIALIGVPAAVALGISWVDTAAPVRGERAAPSWVQSESVRATTSDGTSVQARVAIDAGNADTRSALEQERLQVSLMLQSSVASHSHQAVMGASGMRRLSGDMRDRLNDFLASRQVEPVRDVVVQDLLVQRL